MKNCIRIQSIDDVAVALESLDPGTLLDLEGDAVVVSDLIPKGHKVALRQIEKDQQIMKYGQVVGIATHKIGVGAHVHVHNVRTSLSGHLAYDYTPIEVQESPPITEKTFMGYKRESGEVGIRNELWIVPTVGCINGIATKLQTQFNLVYSEYGLEVRVWSHAYGCSQLGQDHGYTRAIIADIIKHPNAGGVLVMGLGCENNHIQQLKDHLGSYDPSRVKFLETQSVEDELEAGLESLLALATVAKEDRREAVSISALRIGLKCGGSDGLSGITANPLVGAFSDKLIQMGGSTVLTEVPEMFGAETVLMKRAKDEETFNQVVKLIDDFKTYYEDHNQPIYENPSPGNKEGGITTLEDKSLGCIQKGGNAIVEDVIAYGERLKRRGLTLLEAPGNDLVASTALAASGCHIVLFTTGRGTPFGTFVPTMKISSNTELAIKKPHWIDFDAGKLISHETMTMDRLSEELLEKVIAIASGERVMNERNGYAEIAIFKVGVTL